MNTNHTRPEGAAMNLVFKTTGTATYRVSEVDVDQAEYVGCPTATHRLEGRYATTYGYFMATGKTPGTEVRVPGWTSARKGVRAVFVPAVIVAGDTEPIDGYYAD